jgi:transcriptional regulator
MYTPRFNQVNDRAILIEAMRSNPFTIVFGPLSNQDIHATPSATHLPLVVKDEGAHGILEGHFARANSHWTTLSGRETLVIFSGPHSYVSPSLYAEPLSVPTWNYIAVHAYGTMELIDDPVAKDALLKGLIEEHEPAYSKNWRTLPEGFRETMLAGIIGFRIPIARVEGKFKLSQNRPDADRRSVHAAHAAGAQSQQSLAAWMERLGVLPRESTPLEDAP